MINLSLLENSLFGHPSHYQWHSIRLNSWSVIVHVDLQNDLRACASDKSAVEFYDDDTDLSKKSCLTSPTAHALESTL